MLHNKFIIFSLLFIFLGIIVFPTNTVFGHGMGIDYTSIDVDGKNIEVSIELPLYFEESEDKQITITATDTREKENIKNVTFLIGLFHQDELILRNYFFAPDGYLSINVNPTDVGDVKILGEQDSLLGAWHATESQPLEITGPLFKQGGLYTFEIEIRTIYEPTNIREDLGVSVVDVSISEITQHLEEDLEGNDVSFRLRSYFDNISNFQYKPEQKQVIFEMPFDWSESKMSHIPVVHEEVHFPKDFEEFLSPSYIGKVNDIELFKSSITIDDYTEEDERIVHFVLLQDHLRFLKNQMKKSGEVLPDNIVFTLEKNTDFDFPISAATKNEEFIVDLSWDPINIEPLEPTKFIFTIRDGMSGSTVTQSTYDFVIIQNGQEIHRNSGNAVVGGGFEEYIFSEEHTGPTIIKFENIRGTDAETEFGIVVTPEFGTIAVMILGVAIVSIIVVTAKTKVIPKL